MKFSIFTKTMAFLIIFLTACQPSTPTPISISATSPTPTTPPTLTPNPPTPTPISDIISARNASLLIGKLINMGNSQGNPTYSPDGKWLYMPFSVGWYAYNIEAQQFSLISPVVGGIVSPNGKIISTSDGRLISIDGSQQEISLQLTPRMVLDKPYTNGVFSTDGSLLARTYTLNDDKTNRVGVWRVADGKIIGMFPGKSMRISADNSLIVIWEYVTSTSQDNDETYIHVYDLETSKELGSWPTARAAFLPDSSLALESDGHVLILDPQTHQTKQRTFTGKFATFSPDAKIVALLVDRSVNIYRVADGARLQSLKIDLSTVDYANLDFSPDGQTLATYVYEQHCCSGYVEMTILWRVKDGTLITKLQPYQVIFSPDSQTLFSGGKILKTSDGTLIADLIGRSINNISNLGFTADGQQIIASSNPYFYIYQVTDPPSMLAEFDNKEKYKSILEAASPHNFYDVPSNVSQETTSPDGKFVASNLNGIVTMKNVTSTQEPFAIPTTQVTRVAFSPDGQTLALGLQNGTVELWDLKNKQLGYTIPSPNDDPKNYVGGLAFSPNGKLLAVGMKNGTLYLFRIKLPESP